MIEALEPRVLRSGTAGLSMHPAHRPVGDSDGVPEPAAMIVPPLLDIDGDGTADALTDGIILARHLFGFSGDVMTRSATAATATRNAAQMAARLTDARQVLDVDGDGDANALTDGVLAIRFLLGFRGQTLVRDATAPGAIHDAGTLTDRLITMADPGQAAGIADPDLVVHPAPRDLPAAGVPFIDPVFGTTITRVSDTRDAGGFETQVYSQLQAFSSDNAYLLLTGSQGYVVRRMSDFSLVQDLVTWTWNVPRWHPAMPHVLVHFDTNEDNDVTVQYTDVDTLMTTDVFTFPAEYRTIAGNQSFDEISEDGRWMAGMVRRADGEGVIFAYNLAERRLGALLPISRIYQGHAEPDPEWGMIEPDWIGVSPLGRTLVVMWARDGFAGGNGLETFDLETGQFIGRAYEGHAHGDLGVTADGTGEYYVTFELSSPADPNRPAVGLRSLPGTDTASPATLLQTIDWFNSDHISARGPNGVALVTAGTGQENGWTPFEGELYLLSTDGSVLRLTHHRSSGSGYWVQPRASISRDGRYVVFASDWGRNTGGLGDPYVIDLWAGALPG